MGRRESRRLGVVQAAVQGRMTNREGALALGLSLRQFKRLRKQVREREAAGVVHGNRGRPSMRRLCAEVRERVREMLIGEVKLNDHHLAELLVAEGIVVSPASVRRIRQEHRLPPKRRRRPPRHRRRRERRARRGELVLIDGSPFQWFDVAGPAWTLLGAIDDATGDILALTLRPTEDLHGYVTLLRDLIATHGVPECLYGDRSGILIRNDKHWSVAEELAGRQSPTHFGRMLEALAVRFIAATSPQAKGRVERLWATLQDRLAAELRLRGLTTFEAAMAYLPTFIHDHNQRRGRAPADSASAFRPAPRDLDRILACVYERVVARDNTVRVTGRWIQVPPGPHRRSWHKARVEVRELLDGRALVVHPRHGVLVEQPGPGAGFVLESRRGPRESQRLAQNDARGSHQSRDRDPARPRSRPKSQGLGTLTNIRRPSPSHPWKRAVNPNRPPTVAGAGG